MSLSFAEVLVVDIDRATSSEKESKPFITFHQSALSFKIIIVVGAVVVTIVFAVAAAAAAVAVIDGRSIAMLFMARVN